MSIAAVFPGQGSQSVGMLSELYTEFSCVKETCSEASDVLAYDIWELIQKGSAEKLKQTQFTQPVMFVSGMAIWRVWKEVGGPSISMLAGHSLGEYAALTASGVFNYAEALALVAERGRLMASAVPDGEGGMAAILGLDDDKVVALCGEIHGDRVVQAVNFNSPGQVVISGHLDAVETVVNSAKESGARRAVVLPVSVPNHSALMDAIAAPLAEKIDTMSLKDATIPIVQNLHGKSYDNNGEIIGALKKHVCNPVYWTHCVRQLKDDGAEIIIEMGPGKVLTGLNRRIDKSLKGTFIADVDSLNNAIALCNSEAN